MKPSVLLALSLAWLAQGQTPTGQTNTPWPSQPITLNQALDIALQQSPALLKGRQDIEESYGVALQLKSAIMPRLTSGGSFRAIDNASIESFNQGGIDVKFQNDKAWNANVVVSQPIYAGGKLQSQTRSATLTREAALAQFQAQVSDVLLSIKIAYDDTLLALEQIGTQKASIALLERELADQKRRFEAGTAPRFNVLRAEVELANTRPKLIRAQNAFRIHKNNLATLLGWNIPAQVQDDIPLELADRLKATPFEISLPVAIAKAAQQRPELTVRKADEKIRQEGVIQAKSDYYPNLAIGGGYQWQSRTFANDLALITDGWTAGAQMNWSLFDFGLTRGRVDAAKARLNKAKIESDDTVRRIELEVRTAYSNFIEAQQVLESQVKVIEQAEEAVRLSMARNDAGTGTQLDVLSAQTALTDARTIQSQALRDYATALAKLERAMGEGTRMEMQK